MGRSGERGRVVRGRFGQLAQRRSANRRTLRKLWPDELPGRTSWTAFLPLWLGAALLGTAYGAGWLDGLSTGSPATLMDASGRVSFSLCHSVQHRGISGAKHEFDISVFEKPGADFIRHHGGGPYAGDSVCGLELKAYDSSTTIPKSFARAFVGAVLDTDPLAIVSASLGFSVAASRPWPFRPRYALLTTADISADALRYLKRYRVQGNVHVDPTSRRALGAIVSHIRKWL